MHRYLIRRLLLTIPVLLGVATLVFSLIHFIPGDPAQAMLGEGAAPDEVAQLRARLGLDRPLLVQYGSFLQGLARGDLGVSLRNDQPVLQQILERMPATAELALLDVLTTNDEDTALSVLTVRTMSDTEHDQAKAAAELLDD